MFGTRTFKSAISRSLIGALTFAFVAVGAGCGSSSSDGNGNGNGGVDVDIVKSAEQRIRVADLDITSQDKAAIVHGNTEFAIDLYKEVSDNDDNVFFSPFSISQALGMASAGAKGLTAEEMIETLGFSDLEDVMHPGFNWLDDALHNLAGPVVNETSEPFELSIANALWSQKDVDVEAPFLDTLAQHYGAGMYILDFIGETELSRITINEWVEEQTADKIKDLLQPGVITDLTRFVLTNAIYFKASWLFPFEEDKTEPADFHLANGSTVQADMMHQQDVLEIRAAVIGDTKVVEVPYDGGNVSMLVFLPDSIEDFDDALDADFIDDAVAQLSQHVVTLSLPKFDITLPLNLKGTLQSMGMVEAFTNDADFTGITDEIKPLKITDVVHKAFIAIDESGTEAAAATAVIIGTESAPVGPELDFIADRPFFFVIRDNDTDTILFMGRVSEP